MFLCHNHVDKPAVRALARRLEHAGLLPLPHIHAAAVLVGSELGPWQEKEAQVLLDELTRRGRPMIPVYLRCERPAPLPLFLRAMTIVDLRAEVPDPIEQLVWGITGKRPHD